MALDFNQSSSSKSLRSSSFSKGDIIDPALAVMAGLPAIVSAASIIGAPARPVSYSDEDVLKKVSGAVRKKRESIYSVGEVGVDENGRRMFYVDCMSKTGYLVSVRANGSKVLQVRKLGKEEDDKFYRETGSL